MNAAYGTVTGGAPGERCSKRDLPMELAAPLKPHGIRLLLYLPCQTPNGDLRAVHAFGLPETPVNGGRKIDLAFAQKWAGELNEPFPLACEGRWLSGSQWHVLTFLGKTWGKRDTRYTDKPWASWVSNVTAKGGCVTFDLGPNYDAAVAPVGTFSEAQLNHLRAIVKAARK